MKDIPMKWLRSFLIAALVAICVPAYATVQSTFMRDANLVVPLAAYAVTTINTFSAPRTLTLPAAAATNLGSSGAATYYQNTLVFYDGANAITGSNTLTITAATGDTINGASTLVISTQGATVTLAPINGSAWKAVVSGAGNAVIPAVTCSAQFVRSIASTGLGTCATVALATDVSGTLAVANGGASPAGQLPATATNDDAAAGKVGEYISSSVITGSAVSLTTVTAADLTSIALTTGDWDVWTFGYFNMGGSTTVTLLEMSISATTATRNNTAGEFAQVGYPTGSVVGGNAAVTVFAQKRLSLAAPATIYGVAYSSFGVSTNAVWGGVYARRRR